MATGSRSILCVLGVAGALIGLALAQTPAPEGRVTAIFHDVKLLPAQADSRAAEINDKVDEGSALRTGNDSRSELTFADLTITRLGENTIFSVNKAGRSVQLDSGSILLYVRKNSGGAEISTKAVSVGITGTTVIFESEPANFNRLLVLEGTARFSLNDFPDQSTEVRAGQLLNVNAGAKKLPKPGRVDLRRIMRTHPLIKNFPPLPSLDLILAVAEGRNPNPPSPQPSPPITGTGSQTASPPVYVPNPPGPPPLWWCCIDGQVVQSSESECRARGGQAFRSEQEARAHCGRAGTWWCCIDGKVVEIPEAQARVRGNQCYRSREEALAHCGKLCWVCIDGKVAQVQEAEARARRAQCYGSEEEARKNCRGGGQTSTPTPTPYHRPSPTPRPTPRPTFSRPKPKPTATPRKRWPPPKKRPTPTPTPRNVIR
jgi:hypothetical protein